MKSKRILTPDLKRKIDLAVQSIEHCSGIDKYQWMMSRTRNSPAVLCRKIFSYLLHSKLKMNLCEIGGLVNRDHSSIIHHIRSIDEWFQMQKIYEKEIDMLNKCVMEYSLSFTDDVYIDRDGNKWTRTYA